MSISKAEQNELCCVYAALLLFDDGQEINADKLNKVITASGNTVDSYYPEFFAKYFESVDFNKLLQNIGTSAASESEPSAAPADAKKEDNKKDDKKKDDKKKDDKKKEAPKKKEVVPEDDDDEPLGLF